MHVAEGVFAAWPAATIPVEENGFAGGAGEQSLAATEIDDPPSRVSNHPADGAGERGDQQFAVADRDAVWTALALPDRWVTLPRGFGMFRILLAGFCTRG